MAASSPESADAFFPGLAADLPLGLVALDELGVVRYANPAALTLLGEGLIGQSWAALRFSPGGAALPTVPGEETLRRADEGTITVRLRPCSTATGLAFFVEPIPAPDEPPTRDSENRLRLLI